MIERSPSRDPNAAGESSPLRGRLIGLLIKESLQILRDPSSILIAFVLPVVLLFLFAFAVSLDLRDVRVGVVVESDADAALDLAAAFEATDYLAATFARSRSELEPMIVDGRLRGLVVIPQDFVDRIAGSRGPAIEVITDGASPNTANFVASYSRGVLNTWLENRTGVALPQPPIGLEQRFWFNPELESKATIAPGSIAIVMTMIGTLLTALVVAREWERGTMEALMSTPAGIVEILVSKLLPYFALGLGATWVCAVLVRYVFGVPFVGSWFALTVLSATFLIPALGQGLLISGLTKNQFLAAQISLFSGFLPAFLLSGFLFEIKSMPVAIQLITYVIPARYFVSSLQTVFLAGDLWGELLAAMLPMLAIAAVFFAITAATTRKRLD
jgi:ABC-2 type transport system permease protein